MSALSKPCRDFQSFPSLRCDVPARRLCGDRKIGHWPATIVVLKTSARFFFGTRGGRLIRAVADAKTFCNVLVELDFVRPGGSLAFRGRPARTPACRFSTNPPPVGCRRGTAWRSECCPLLPPDMRRATRGPRRNKIIPQATSAVSLRQV